MKNTNIVVVVGNLTGDAELKHTAGGIPYFQFSLAVSREQYNAETKSYDKKTDFFNNLAIFGKRAEAIVSFMKKGTKLLVQGSLQTNSYDKNGTTVNTLELKVESIEFLRFATTLLAINKEEAEKIEFLRSATMTEPDIKVDPNEPIYEGSENDSENDFGIY